MFVTNYPTAIKPFYAKVDDDPRTCQAVDLLVPKIGELIGGSIREDNHTKLLAQMKQKSMNVQQYQWYLDLRKYGSVPHGGWGLGFERLVMFVTGLENIRDVIPLPRAPNICSF